MSEEKRNYELSTVELKKMKGFENISEDKAKEICFQLKELSFILYEIYQTKLDRESSSIENKEL